MAQPLCSMEWKKGGPGDKAAEKKEVERKGQLRPLTQRFSRETIMMIQSKAQRETW